MENSYRNMEEKRTVEKQKTLQEGQAVLEKLSKAMQKDPVNQDLSMEETLQAKLFLFKEFNKLEEMRDSLEQERRALEKKQKDLDEKEHKISQNTKALMEKELFFEKKMEILKDGFQMMDADRRKLEQDRAQLEIEKKHIIDEQRPRRNQYMNAFDVSGQLKNAVFFAGVNSLLACKKRYKDLLKIYHPDNFAGDSDTFVAIKAEYEKVLDYYEGGSSSFYF